MDDLCLSLLALLLLMCRPLTVRVEVTIPAGESAGEPDVTSVAPYTGYAAPATDCVQSSCLPDSTTDAGTDLELVDVQSQRPRSDVTPPPPYPY